MEKFSTYLEDKGWLGKLGQATKKIFPSKDPLKSPEKSSEQLTDRYTGPGGWILKLYDLAKRQGGQLAGSIKILPFGSAKGKDAPGLFFGQPGKTGLVYENVEFEEVDLINEGPEADVGPELVSLRHHSTEVVNINANQIKHRIKQVFHTGKKPLFIWGAMGIGKTNIVEQAARELGVDLIIMELSTRDPVDFLGLPDIDRERGVTIYHPPDIFPKDNGKYGKGGILFFDEMNNANEVVLKSAYRIVRERRIEGRVLPDKWNIICAGNRKEESPTVTDLQFSLRNRLAHVNYEPQLDHWIDWAMSSLSKDSDGNQVIDRDLIAFLKFKPDLFFHLNQAQEPEAFATPRTWAEASHQTLLETVLERKEKGDPTHQLPLDEVKLIYQSWVGNSPAIQFIAFKKLMTSGKVNLDQLKLALTSDYKKAPLPPQASTGAKNVGGRAKTTINMYQPDIAYAMMSALAQMAGRNCSFDTFSNIVGYSLRLKCGEISIFLLRSVLRDNPSLMEDVRISDLLHKWEIVYGKEIEREWFRSSKEAAAAHAAGQSEDEYEDERDAAAAAAIGQSADESFKVYVGS